MLANLRKKELLLFFTLLATLESFQGAKLVASSGRPPLLKSVPATSFSCAGRPSGYYADIEAGCQAYHMCGMNGRQYSYLCPSYTLFHQKYMVCDHHRQVDCSATEKYYDLNLKIGKVPNKNKNSRDKKTKIKSSSPIEIKKFSTRTRSPPILTPQSAPEKPPVTKIAPNPLSLSTTLTLPAKDPVTKLKEKDPKPVKQLQVTKVSFEGNSPKDQVPHFNSIQIDTKSARIGRGSSGVNFLFGRNRKESRDSTDINGVKFHPIVVRPIRTIFEEESFTIRPEILRTISHPFVEEEEENINNAPEKPFVNREFQDIPTFLIPPLPSIPKVAPQKVSTFLLPPPPEAPIVLEGPNQEKKTPLVFSRRGIFSRPNRPFSFLSGGSRGQSEIIFSTPTVRGNPDFFIPSPGLLPPLPGNNIEQESKEQGRHHHHRMTMTFPNEKHSLGLAPLALNPKCPQCHPAFLRRNQCSPCVIIK